MEGRLSGRVGGQEREGGLEQGSGLCRPGSGSAGARRQGGVRRGRTAVPPSPSFLRHSRSPAPQHAEPPPRAAQQHPANTTHRMVCQMVEEERPPPPTSPARSMSSHDSHMSLWDPWFCMYSGRAESHISSGCTAPLLPAGAPPAPPLPPGTAPLLLGLWPGPCPWRPGGSGEGRQGEVLHTLVEREKGGKRHPLSHSCAQQEGQARPGRAKGARDGRAAAAAAVAAKLATTSGCGPSGAATLPSTPLPA